MSARGIAIGGDGVLDNLLYLACTRVHLVVYNANANAGYDGISLCEKNKHEKGFLL